MTAVVMAVTLLKTSFLWSSARAMAVPDTFRSRLHNMNKPIFSAVAEMRMAFVANVTSNSGFSSPMMPSNKPSDATRITFKERVHISTALTMIATGSRRVFPAGNLTLGLAISRSATNRTSWLMRSTVESTNDEKMA
eukprot:CAMPEP_0198210944 /NCGR_PEP_ID=MMETSP1445-20131203/22531_1 /TAXON_ID=36898 /ORGANISM="Pyramimonas sp., Strain CCMP2087" /LENGTH=136 /DNA_ID=CAMNT_0043885113 /DNA_START=851 /DNA_END=1261 /DNA_ORIENTATION=+